MLFLGGSLEDVLAVAGRRFRRRLRAVHQHRVLMALEQVVIRIGLMKLVQLTSHFLFMLYIHLYVIID